MVSILESLRNLLKPHSNQNAPRSAVPRVLSSDTGLVFEVEAVRRGGMGVVYLCRARDSNGEASRLPLALKTFEERFFFNADMSLAVQRESALWMRVSDVPFIVPLMGILTIDHKPYLMMPAATPDAGGAVSMGEAIRRSPSGLSIETCLELALCLSVALDFAARRVPGIVHGDIKPDNILFIGRFPCLADFGLARLGTDGGRAGTPPYMAPELWADNGGASIATDVYAFGATLFEALSGHPPFQTRGSRADEWTALHEREVPAFPEPLGGECSSLHESLRRLALRALSKSPAERPSDFGQIWSELVELGAEEAPEVYLSVLLAAPGFSLGSTEERHRLLGFRVSNLLSQGQYEAALELLSSIPGDEIAGDLLLTAGSVHSLNGDDETALAFFERFLETRPEEEERWRCLSEYGLSLRRLGRLEEAKILYERLLDTATGRLRVTARGNYAAVLLDLGETGSALNHLEWLTRNHPDGPESWGLLSMALDRSGEPERAVDAMRQAIARFPRDGRYQVMMADLLFRQGRLVEALAALDIAYGLGHHTREWLKLTLATNVALGRTGDVNSLSDAVRAQLPPGEMEALLDDVCDLLARLGESTETPAGDGGESRSISDSGEGFEIGPGDRASGEAGPGTATERTSTEPTPAGPAPRRATDEMDNAEEHRKRIRSGTQPHAQMRMSAVDNSFVIDFYFGADAPGYVEAFRQSYSQARWRLESSWTGLGEREAPYRFARCQHCGFDLLTARDEGESFVCQACGERGLIQAIRTPALDGLALECERAIGREPVTEEQPVALFVAFWMDDPADARVVAARMAADGFTAVPPEAAAFAHFEMLVQERNVEIPARLDQIWHRPLTAGDGGLDGRTPPFLDRVIRELRRKIGSVTSASAAFPQMMVDALLADPAGRARLVREMVAANPDDRELKVSLVVAEINAGNVREASRIAAGMEVVDPNEVYALRAAAHVALAEKKPGDAVPRLERVLEATPRDLGARAMMITALNALGDDAGVAHHLAQFSAMGGRVPAKRDRAEP